VAWLYLTGARIPGRDSSAGGYVPHVELSITDFGPVTPPAPRPVPEEASAESEDRVTTEAPAVDSTDLPTDPLGHWVRAVAGAVEPCLVIDADGVIVAMSPSCVELMSLPASPVGADLRSGPFRLVDFSADGGKLSESEVGKVPPILAVSSGRLARGLIRVRCGDAVATLDAIATPIGPTGAVAGSLTFVSPV
jgi:hypothetical protein